MELRFEVRMALEKHSDASLQLTSPAETQTGNITGPGQGKQAERRE